MCVVVPPPNFTFPPGSPLYHHRFLYRINSFLTRFSISLPPPLCLAFHKESLHKKDLPLSCSRERGSIRASRFIDFVRVGTTPTPIIPFSMPWAGQKGTPPQSRAEHHSGLNVFSTHGGRGRPSRVILGTTAPIIPTQHGPGWQARSSEPQATLQVFLWGRRPATCQPPPEF